MPACQLTHEKFKSLDMKILKFEEIENKIIEIRGRKVILGSDVAELYSVETRDINKAVKNNPDKFPAVPTIFIVCQRHYNEFY